VARAVSNILLRQALVDQHDDWQLEEAQTVLAYESWAAAQSSAGRFEAYRVYRAALRREEEACELYAKLVAAFADAAEPPVRRVGGAARSGRTPTSQRG
jgi:hypothetical protein